MESSSSASQRKAETKDESNIFGAALRKDFLFDADYLNLNHGSFGTYPLPVHAALQHYQSLAEARPDEFIRYTYPTLLDSTRALISKTLNCPTSSLVFVPNATVGMNTVLRNLVFAPGDVILFFSSLYGGVAKTIAHLVETTPVRPTRIEYTYPISDTTLLQLFSTAVSSARAKGQRVRIAVFDTITAMPGMLLPYAQLTALCRDLGVLSAIDAAHGIGHIPLDLSALDPDFLVSNVHKWYFAPRPCAILYAPTRNQHLLRTSIPTSHGFEPLPETAQLMRIGANPLPPARNKSAFEANFEFVGTADAGKYLCALDAKRYREEVLGGEERIMRYCVGLAREGGKIFADVLGTEVMRRTPVGEEDGNECFFANVRLAVDPATIVEMVGGEEEFERGGWKVKVRDWVSERVMRKHGVFLAGLWYEGAWWIRLSATVYLDVDDFRRAAEWTKAVCEAAEAGEIMDGKKAKL